MRKESKIMSYEEFLQQIKNEITKQVPNSNQVMLNTVLKNNNCKLDAISIVDPKETITPNIYLNQYYEQYQSGRDLRSIAELIIKLSKERVVPEKAMIPDVTDFNSIAHLITYRLVNWEKNRERLRTIPYEDAEDLVKIFYIVIKSDANGISSIPITDALMEKWYAVFINQLNEYADKNTPVLFPATIRDMNEVIKDMVFKDLRDNSLESMSQDDYDDIINMLNTNQKVNEKMYVLSNDRGINGASTLLYPNVLYDFASSIRMNFYILPSSIHECILVPDTGKLSKAALKEMVKDVNDSHVSADEVLSNEVYYYDLATDEFHIIPD
jgi:hypothetical protein